MNVAWMREQLDNFVSLVKRYEATRPPGEYVGNEDLYDELHRAEPVVRRILQTLDPQLGRDLNIDQLAGPAMAASDAQRGIGLLQSLADLNRNLAPDAPSMVADRLHNWVWSAAQTFWETGHYRSAVHTAASAINAHTQAKLQRTDVSDDKLMQEAFSDRPPEPNKSRLLLPGDPLDQTRQSRQRGALQLGMGCFYAIRNPAAHTTEEWPEQLAMEYLATLSVLARLIDECEVSTGVGQ